MTLANNIISITGDNITVNSVKLKNDENFANKGNNY